MADGTRTRDNRNHNPGLYQLSYSHHKIIFRARILVRPAGLEPTTPGLEGRCSIRLSYGHILAGKPGFLPPKPKARNIRYPLRERQFHNGTPIVILACDSY